MAEKIYGVKLRVYSQGAGQETPEFNILYPKNRVQDILDFPKDLVNISMLNDAIKEIPSGDNQLVYRGEWIAGTSYKINDIIYYNGKGYITIINTNTSTNPESIANRVVGTNNRYFTWLDNFVTQADKNAWDGKRQKTAIHLGATDVNNITATGEYRLLNQASDYQNLPTGAIGWGVLEVISSDNPSDWVIAQRYHADSTNRMWFRILWGTVWRAWKEVATTDSTAFIRRLSENAFPSADYVWGSGAIVPVTGGYHKIFLDLKGASGGMGGQIEVGADGMWYRFGYDDSKGSWYKVATTDKTVNLAGDQVIEGIKHFNGLPRFNSGQIVKGVIDFPTNSGGTGEDWKVKLVRINNTLNMSLDAGSSWHEILNRSTGVALTGDQTISGSKTFTNFLFQNVQDQGYVLGLRGTNGIFNGNRDDAAFDGHNIYIKAWWGLGIRDYNNDCRIVFDARTGNIKTKGALYSSFIDLERGNANEVHNVVNVSGGTGIMIPVIRVKGRDANGHSVAFGSNCGTVVGAGEFTGNMMNEDVSAENLHLGADGNVYIYSNANTFSSRHTTTYNTSGDWHLPNSLYIYKASGTTSPNLLIGPDAPGDNIYSLVFGQSIAGSKKGMGQYSAARGTFGKHGLGIHIPTDSEFSILSDNWKKVWGVNPADCSVNNYGNLNMSGNIYFTDTGTTTNNWKGIYGRTATNDGWIIRGYTRAGTNEGALEIATGDDGMTAGQTPEPIYVRQYSGDPWSTTIGINCRELVLLGTSGETRIPGALYANTNVTTDVINTKSTGNSIMQYNSGQVRIGSVNLPLRLDTNAQPVVSISNGTQYKLYHEGNSQTTINGRAIAARPTLTLLGEITTNGGSVNADWNTYDYAVIKVGDYVWFRVEKYFAVSVGINYFRMPIHFEGGNISAATQVGIRSNSLTCESYVGYFTKHTVYGGRY